MLSRIGTLCWWVGLSLGVALIMLGMTSSPSPKVVDLVAPTIFAAIAMVLGRTAKFIFSET